MLPQTHFIMWQARIVLILKQTEGEHAMSGLAVQHSVNAGTQNTVGQDWRGLPTWFRVRNPPASKAGDLGDVGSILCWEDALEEGMATHFQDSCLENPMDRGAWRATVHGVSKESDTTQRPSTAQ